MTSMPSSARRSGVLDARLAVDSARVGLAVVHLARLLDEIFADILGIRQNLVAQFLQLPKHLPLLRIGACRLHDRRLLRGRNFSAGFLLACCRNRRRHQRLVDLARTADRAFDETSLLLAVMIGGRRKPALEAVLLFALKRIADHDAAAARLPGSCTALWPSTLIEKSRPCDRFGIFARTVPGSAGSISHTSTPGSSWASSAASLPHGS